MIKIICDLFDIASRLREIDKQYVLFYNPKMARYELHRENRGRVSYELTLPYDTLDARTVEFCQKTRVERKERLIKELDRENELLEKMKTDEARKKAENSFEQYLSKSGGTK